ncbi:MAG: hypothetical protein HFG55_01005 [Lachnospiraceae bacterium]|nr:hypothetical protein [Lachnospiraceae bacterium]
MDTLAFIILIVGMLAMVILPVLMIVATWKLFDKANEPGWKALIPLYSTYIQYKITWKTQYFFLLLGCLCVTLIIPLSEFLSVFLLPLALIAYAVIFFLNLISAHKLSTAYGHDIGFTLGLIFLQPIFLIILGFGSSKYEGPQ